MKYNVPHTRRRIREGFDQDPCRNNTIIALIDDLLKDEDSPINNVVAFAGHPQEEKEDE